MTNANNENEDFQLEVNWTGLQEKNHPSALPKLKKSRMLHTKYFILFMVPVAVLVSAVLEHKQPLHEAMEWLGHALVILCVLGRSYSSLFIGGKKNDALIMDGPYSIVRNPLYVFSFLGVVGIGLQSGVITLTTVLALAFVFYYPSVIKHEEARLEYNFGSRYRAYMQRVPRWWPNWSLWSEPELVVARPKFLRKTMLDALPFFLAFPAFELIKYLQQAGHISPLLNVI